MWVEVEVVVLDLDVVEGMYGIGVMWVTGV